MENNQEQVSGKELYELKREEKLKEKESSGQKGPTKRIIKIVVLILAIGGLGGFSYYAALQPPIPENEIISKHGVHWHAQLKIFVKGKEVQIPANLGLGAVHDPIHTHDTTGTLHLELQGLVLKKDFKLEKFFKVWDKDFMEFGSSVSMTVNGEKNTDLNNYEMKDGDRIELNY